MNDPAANLEQALPVREVLGRIGESLEPGSRVVLCAAPGAGKTTLVPSYVLDQVLPLDQHVVLVQPRRLAARATARRIAFLRGEEPGQTVGYQVRFERRTSRDTRITVMTEGVLLRRLQSDAELNEIGCVILDEFHERSIDSDLLLGMLRRVQETLRPDLRILLMSATMDRERIAQHLDRSVWIHSHGRQHPVTITYLPRPRGGPIDVQVADQLNWALQGGQKHTLVFLPGASEIHQTAKAIGESPAARGCIVLKLYGSLPAEQQDAVLQPSDQRKIILATNIAETSLTIDGVDTVIDSGLARVPAIDDSTGLPRLDTVPISQAEADQRAGRAGRQGPGRCLRLWTQDNMKSRQAYPKPEILRCDISGALLKLLAWGEHDLQQFPWIDVPSDQQIAEAMERLTMLGAVREGRVTKLGRTLSLFPAEPIVARLLVAGHQQGVAFQTAVLAAMLSERDPWAGDNLRWPTETVRRGTPSARRENSRERRPTDVVDRIALLQEYADSGGEMASPFLSRAAADQVLRVANQLHQQASELLGDSPRRLYDASRALGRAILDAFPDRVAVRRERGRPRGLMVGGHGVVLEGELAQRDAPLFVCVRVSKGSPESRVSLATSIEADWLTPEMLDERDELFFNPTQKQVQARRRTYYRDLQIAETPAAVEDNELAAQLLTDQALKSLEAVLPSGEWLQQWIARVDLLASGIPELGLPRYDQARWRDIVARLAWGRRSFQELREADWQAALVGMLTPQQQAAVARLAPERLDLPRNRTAALRYELGQPPVLAARIQDLFGMRSTPRIADRRIPVLLHLLGPNMRVQQITDDIESFWRNTYPTVRKELRRRYPKHAWPENPCDGKETA